MRRVHGLAISYLKYIGLHVIYRDPCCDEAIMGTRWEAYCFGPLFRLRDAAVRSWAQHCFDLQLIREGERVPWPRWLRFGWRW